MSYPQPYTQYQQQPGWGPAQWPPSPVGYAAPGQPPTAAPPPKRSRLRLVLLGLLAVTVLAVAGLAATVVLTTSAGPTPYVNDDHEIPPPEANPPPLPKPATAEEAQQWSDANAIYNQPMPVPVRCEVPRIPLNTATDEQLLEHFNALMACLVRVWEVPATAAGFVIVRPSVTLYDAQISTACGTTDNTSAFYCTLDQQVYFSKQYPKRVPIVGTDPWAGDFVMAHEFGHSVQARTGIHGGWVMQARATDEAGQLMLSRRSETQADCFSGLFAHSVSRSIGLQQSDLTGILEYFFAKGDRAGTVGTHGQGATRRYWGQVGLGSDQVGACNTFIAPPELVR